MKIILGVVVVVFALVIGILPLFTDCQSQGLALTLQNGQKAPMKCHWTGLAEIGAAVPLALVGGFTATSRRKGTLRMLAVFGVALGALAILFPTVLIGVCANPAHLCNMIMRPGLVLSGVLVIAASLVTLVIFRKGDEPAV